MSNDSGAAVLDSARTSRDPALEPIRASHRHPVHGGRTRKQWRVELEAGDERVEADEVEVLASGVLTFYRFQTRQETERILLVAFAPSSWRRCSLDSEA